ncbi:MAG: DUF3892 domain-containing protein [Polyangia bacterium]
MRWADFVITAVRYDPDRSHITELLVRTDNGDTLGAGTEWTRADVVLAIRRGQTFVTAFSTGSSFARGADVRVEMVGNEQFLRTDRNQRRADNLGELPELAQRAFGASLGRW